MDLRRWDCDRDVEQQACLAMEVTFFHYAVPNLGGARDICVYSRLLLHTHICSSTHATANSNRYTRADGRSARLSPKTVQGWEPNNTRVSNRCLHRSFVRADDETRRRNGG